MTNPCPRYASLAVILVAAAGCAESPAAPKPSSAMVTIDATHSPATISGPVLGANFGNWYDLSQSGLANPLVTAGLTSARYPGGSQADSFHWLTNTVCAPNGLYVGPGGTFDVFMQNVAQAAQLDVAITVNYGTNAACNAGGDPTEAAAWVKYANTTRNYGIKWWTVGNEEFGSWETDLHPIPNDPTTYANAVATGYYPDIKAADPTSLVGVDADPTVGSGVWDRIVLGSAKYDFVELHFYAQNPWTESDTYLLNQAPGALTSEIKALKGELAAAGHSVPIMVGELGSSYAAAGKQTVSITQALFAGEAIGELLNAGVMRADWWIAYGNCFPASNQGNYSDSLYGWQNWAAYSIFADGPEYPDVCGGLPLGTPLPTARAYQVAAQFAHNGERMLSATVNPSLSTVRAYAATQGTGYAVMLFNLDERVPADVSVSINSLAAGSKVLITTYGKAQYDLTKSGKWTGPVSTSQGSWTGTFVIPLPPWSMTVAVVTP